MGRSFQAWRSCNRSGGQICCWPFWSSLLLPAGNVLLVTVVQGKELRILMDIGGWFCCLFGRSMLSLGKSSPFFCITCKLTSRGAGLSGLCYHVTWAARSLLIRKSMLRQEIGRWDYGYASYLGYQKGHWFDLVIFCPSIFHLLGLYSNNDFEPRV